MSDAIIVHEAYKKFGKPASSRWKHLWRGRNVGGSSPEPAVDSGALKNGRDGVVFALDRVSVSIREGEIFGVLGPNGSGKSTLIRLIATLLLPDGGSIEVFGHDVVRQADAGAATDQPGFGGSQLLQEALADGEPALRGAPVRSGRRAKRASGWSRSSPAWAWRSARSTSRWRRCRAACSRKWPLPARCSPSRACCCSTSRPPASIRAPSARCRRWCASSNRDLGTTILLTTHDMLEADALCDRIAIIDGGKIVALDTPAALKRQIPRNGHEVTLEDVFLELTGKQLVKEDEEEG